MNDCRVKIVEFQLDHKIKDREEKKDANEILDRCFYKKKIGIDSSWIGKEECRYFRAKQWIQWTEFPLTNKVQLVSVAMIWANSFWVILEKKWKIFDIKK